MKPYFSVHKYDGKWDTPRTEVWINPGVAKFPRFYFEFYENGNIDHRIEQFPFVKTNTGWQKYLGLLDRGLHDWLRLVEVFVSFQHADDLIGWLQANEIRVGGQYYRFVERVK